MDTGPQWAFSSLFVDSSATPGGLLPGRVAPGRARRRMTTRTGITRQPLRRRGSGTGIATTGITMHNPGLQPNARCVIPGDHPHHCPTSTTVPGAEYFPHQHRHAQPRRVAGHRGYNGRLPPHSGTPSATPSGLLPARVSHGTRQAGRSVFPGDLLFAGGRNARALRPVPGAIGVARG